MGIVQSWLVSVEEALAIRSFMDASGTSLGDIQQVSLLLDMDNDVDVERVVARLAEEATAWTLAEAVRDAYIIASADGEVTNQEISTVERLFELLHLPVENRAKLHSWGRNAAAQQLLGMNARGPQAPGPLPPEAPEPLERARNSKLLKIADSLATSRNDSSHSSPKNTV